MKTYTVSRNVTPTECHWLDMTVPKGTILYEFTGCTYGCIGAGEAVSRKTGQGPFFEMPRSALSVLVYQQETSK